MLFSTAFLTAINPRFNWSVVGGLPAMQKALEIAQSVYAEEDED